MGALQSELCLWGMKKLSELSQRGISLGDLLSTVKEEDIEVLTTHLSKEETFQLILENTVASSLPKVVPRQESTAPDLPIPRQVSLSASDTSRPSYAQSRTSPGPLAQKDLSSSPTARTRPDPQARVSSLQMPLHSSSTHQRRSRPLEKVNLELSNAQVSYSPSETVSQTAQPSIQTPASTKYKTHSPSERTRSFEQFLEGPSNAEHVPASGTASKPQLPPISTTQEPTTKRPRQDPGHQILPAFMPNTENNLETQRHYNPPMSPPLRSFSDSARTAPSVSNPVQTHYEDQENPTVLPGGQAKQDLGLPDDGDSNHVDYERNEHPTRPLVTKPEDNSKSRVTYHIDLYACPWYTTRGIDPALKNHVKRAVKLFLLAETAVNIEETCVFKTIVEKAWECARKKRLGGKVDGLPRILVEVLATISRSNAEAQSSIFSILPVLRPDSGQEWSWKLPGPVLVHATDGLYRVKVPIADKMPPDIVTTHKGHKGSTRDFIVKSFHDIANEWNQFCDTGSLPSQPKSSFLDGPPSHAESIAERVKQFPRMLGKYDGVINGKS